MATIQRRFAARTTTLGVSVAACLTPLVALTPAAAAASLCGPPADTVPPLVTNISLSTSSIDLNSTKRSVTVTATATDATGSGTASGVKDLSVFLEGPTVGGGPKMKLTSGTSTDGTWTGTYTLPKYAGPGTLHVDNVTVTDADNNQSNYYGYGKTPDNPNSISLQSGWQTSVTLTGKAPKRPARPAAGKLSTFGLSPTAVDATHGAKQVHLTATFTGRQPTHAWVYFERASSNRGRQYARSTLKKHGDTWSGHAVISRWIGSHTLVPQLSSEFSGDKPSFRDYTAGALRRRFAAPKLAVKSGTDTTKPVLKSLGFSPSAVNTVAGKQTLTVTAVLLDPKAGVQSADVNLDTGNSTVFAASEAAPVGGLYPYHGGIGFFQGGDKNVRLKHTTGNTWVGTTTFQECEPAGTWKVNVGIGDKAGNFSNYASKKLAAAGLPKTLTVTSTTGDIVDPYVYGSTASSQDGTITLDFSEGVKNVTSSDLIVYPLSPKSTLYQTPDPISAIVCSNGHTSVDCSGSSGLITSATLSVTALAGQVGTTYEVYANQGGITSQLTDGHGNPMDWNNDAADVTDS